MAGMTAVFLRSATDRVLVTDGRFGREADVHGRVLRPPQSWMTHLRHARHVAPLPASLSVEARHRGKALLIQFRLLRNAIWYIIARQRAAKARALQGGQHESATSSVFDCWRNRYRRDGGCSAGSGAAHSRRQSRSTTTTSAAWSPAPNGPEAGVWVIAETTELPTNYAKIVVTDDQGRYVIPDLPTANYQVWVRGYGLVDSPKVRAKPGQQLNLTAVPAPNERAAAHYYPAIYWYAMMKMPPEKDFGGSTDIPKNITRETWRQRMNNVDCIGCHQLGQEATRTIPAQFGEFKTGAEAWMRRIASGQSGELMTNRIAGQLGGVPFKYFGDWTDRVAKGELPQEQAAAAAGRRAQHRRHVVGVGHRRSIHPRPDLVGPAQSDGQCLRSALRLAGVLDRRHADPRSEDAQGDVLQDAGRGSERMPESLGPPCHASRRVKPTQPSAYWGEEKIWDTARQQPQRACSTRRAGSGLPRPCAGIDNPAFCKKGSDHPSAKVFPLEQLGAPGGDARSQDDEVQLHRHLLRHPPSAVRLRRRQHAVALRHRPGGRLGQHQGVGRDRRRGKGAGLVRRSCSTPTATASSTNYRAGQAGGSGQGHALNRGLGSLCGDAAPDRRLGLVHRRRVRRHAGLPALRSEDQAQRVLRHSEGRHRRARRRHRQERRALGLGLDRPPDQLRPAQVQGAAQRAERDRQPLPGRLRALQVSRARASRASRTGAPRRATTPGSTTTTRSGSARTSRSRPPTSRTASSRSRTAR